MNYHLRYGKPIDNENRKNMEYLSQYLANADRNVYGEVFRGQHSKKDYRMEDLLAQTEEDGIYIDKGFMSTSYDIERANHFARLDQDEHSVRMFIEANGINGVDIQDQSSAGYEEEVLFQRDSKFIVISRKVERKPNFPNRYLITLYLREVL